MKYFIRFHGHIIETFRKEGFPKIVSTSRAASVKDLNELVTYVDTQLAMILNNGGFLCWLNESEALPAEEIFQKRLFVPLHMIHHITHEVKLLVDPKGVLDMKSTTLEDAENLEDPNPPIGEEGKPS